MPALLCAPIEAPGSSTASQPTAFMNSTARRYDRASYIGTGGIGYVGSAGQFTAQTATRRPVWSDPSTWAGAPQPPRVAVYSQNPYYPSLGYPGKPEILRVEAVLQPVPHTPLHDPYFDERVFEEFEDAYEYWGW
jgi:hypothetical protein